MESKSPENGFDELMRLSQQFKKQEQVDTKREQQRAEHRKKVQDVLGGLRELKVSMAIEQLKLLSVPEIIEQLESLKSKSGTKELTNLISNLADDLEKSISVISAANPDMKPVEHSVKTLIILMELLFSLK